jgi:hypothetical protein
LHASPPGSYRDEDNVAVGNWVASQRRAYNKNELSTERQALLEKLPGWAWDALEAKWQQNLSDLREFAATEKHVNIPEKHLGTYGRRLDTWVKEQRKKYKKNDLSEERIKLLETIDEWSW